MLLEQVNGRTMQREWVRKKLYRMLDEKWKKDGDLLGDEAVDGVVGVKKLGSREMCCEDGRWPEVTQDCGQ